MPPNQSPERSLWPLLLLLILVNMATALYTLPLNRVVEMRLCRSYYEKQDPSQIGRDGSVPERLCKVDEVQRGLAWIQGGMETTVVVCDFLVTIPFSFLAQRRGGTRLVLWANLVPRVFMSIWALLVGNFERLLPTKAIMAGPFLAVLGGECVFTSTIFTLTSALTDEYVQRAKYFSYVSSISYVVNFIGPTLASISMSQSVWLPFWINIALLLCAVPTVKLLPDIKPATKKLGAESNDEGQLDEEEGPLLEERAPSPGKYSTAFRAPKNGFIREFKSAVVKIVRLIIGRRNFQVMLISMFLTALASSDTKLLVQYISKRYNWTFAEAGYLLSAKALVNVFLLTILVPRIIQATSTSQITHNSEVRMHYLGAQASIGISIVGVLCVAFSSKSWMLLLALILYALGSALPVFTISLVRSPLIALTNSDAHAQDFSIVMLTKTLGSLVGAPLMTVLWVQAIKLGGSGLGLVYWVSGSLYAMAAVVVAQLRF